MNNPEQRFSRSISLARPRVVFQPIGIAVLLMLAEILSLQPVFADGEAAAGSLRFEHLPDGRCHILSEGGKLVVLHNTHPGRSIRYRLLRVFADRPQGLMGGEIAAGAAPQKLGCDKVGGRDQRWTVKRAEFLPEKTSR